MRASVYEVAHAEALKSRETFRLGAVVVRRRTIVSKGHNRNHNRCGLSSIHAEMDALWKARSVKRATVVVVRVRKDGVTLACSKPCHACEKALKRARVLKVIYTTGCDQHPFRTLILNS